MIRGTRRRKIDKAEANDKETRIAPFWRIEKDKVKIDQSCLIDWMESRGFYKAYEHNRDSSTKIERRGNVLHRRSDEQLKDHVLDYARGLDDRRVLAQLRRAANVYLSSKTFECLRAQDLRVQRDKKDRAFFPYRNGVVRVTAEDVELISYDDLDNPVWEDAILQRSIDLIPDYGTEHLHESEFGRFQWLAMKKDVERMQSLMSAQGYLMHGYKNPANARAVIFTDEVISDSPAGRTGKGMCARAYGRMTPTVHIDGRRIDLDSRFAFQSVIPGVTRLVHFNDAGERFPFERLFASITDDMAVERKNRDRVIIPFADSPKFVISTNYVISGRGGSHDGRVFEVEFGGHFNADYTPEDEFGHLLFHDWSPEEWNRFDNLMLHCVQHYLRYGLVPYRHVNLAWKKFVLATSEEFGDFVQSFGFVANEPGVGSTERKTYKKHALLDTFLKEHRKDLSPHTLTKWMKAYAEYRGWEFQNRLGTDRDRYAFVDPSKS